MVGELLLLTVAHTVREGSGDGAALEVIRIISARPRYSKRKTTL
jgi:hypothetical protein